MLLRPPPEDIAKFPYPVEIQLFAKGDRLYPHIYNILIVQSAIAHASKALIERPEGWNSEGNAYWLSKVYPKDLIVNVDAPFRHAMHDIEPDHIGIILVEKGTIKKVDPDGPIVATKAFSGVFQHITEPVFLAFFERYNVWLKKNLGDAEKWPPTLNFARVIRNAVAHGAIDIRSAKTAAATWNGLSYSHADNGRTIIGSDLGSSDLAGLMFDVDDELNKLGVPIL